MIVPTVIDVARRRRRRFGRARPTIPLLFAVFLLAGILAGPLINAHIARAQGNPAAQGNPPATGNTTTPGNTPAPANAVDAKALKDVEDLLVSLDDLDRLHTVNPLKLTADQLDKMIAALATAQSEYDKQVTALGAPMVLQEADEIRTVKKQALKGAAIPKDFDARIAKLQKDFLTKRDALNYQNLKFITTEFARILTADQQKTAAQMARQAASEAHQPTTGADDLWFNSFVLQVFVNYPRIVPLLKEMRAAAGP